jgi:hypothetical protein
MVTHGYVTFKYEGIYYVYNNHSDSYCSCLGENVVNEIDKMINNNYIKYYKKKLLRIPLRDEMLDGENYFNSIYDAIIYYDGYSYYTSNHEPSNEYVYIIDFDEDEFIITAYCNRYIFNLFDIPEDWMTIVEENDNYEYENKEELAKDRIKNKISELEEEINKLKLKL